MSVTDVVDHNSDLLSVFNKMEKHFFRDFTCCLGIIIQISRKYQLNSLDTNKLSGSELWRDQPPFGLKVNISSTFAKKTKQKGRDVGFSFSANIPKPVSLTIDMF